MGPDSVTKQGTSPQLHRVRSAPVIFSSGFDFILGGGHPKRPYSPSSGPQLASPDGFKAFNVTQRFL